MSFNYNSYQEFVQKTDKSFVNGKTLQSQEGTIQGDLLAMVILPLIDLIQRTNITQKWYADDGNVTGSLKDLKTVHELLKRHGPASGYTLTKCNIIANEYRKHETSSKSIQQRRCRNCWRTSCPPVGNRIRICLRQVQKL